MGVTGGLTEGGGMFKLGGGGFVVKKNSKMKC